MPKGMMVWTLRQPDRDCTNKGVSSKFDTFILVGEGIPELFQATEEMPALYLRKKRVSERKPEYLYVIPADVENGYLAGVMFGGNFIYTSDSRFPNDYPIPVHDRRE